jgi:AraC family transcriptional regulator
LPDSDSKSFYGRRVERVLRHIEEHLDEELSVERLAAVAGFSRFHFHRQFRALVGVPVARFVALLRLRQASMALAFREEERVLDIALAAGYESAEAFARAFKASQGQTPSQFRRAPDWQRWHQMFRLPTFERKSDMQPTIVSLDSIPVAVLEHRGPPATLMQSVQKFIGWRKSSTASPEAESRTLGIVYDDPDSVAPQAFRFDICGELMSELEDNDVGIVAKEIAGGRYAVLRHHGSPDLIGPTVLSLYRDWLPGSGENLREAPLFFHYVARTPKVAEHEQITDIYLPLT